MRMSDGMMSFESSWVATAQLTSGGSSPPDLRSGPEAASLEEDATVGLKNPRGLGGPAIVHSRSLILAEDHHVGS